MQINLPRRFQIEWAMKTNEPNLCRFFYVSAPKLQYALSVEEGSTSQACVYMVYLVDIGKSFCRFRRFMFVIIKMEMCQI